MSLIERIKERRERDCRTADSFIHAVSTKFIGWGFTEGKVHNRVSMGCSYQMLEVDINKIKINVLAPNAVETIVGTEPVIELVAAEGNQDGTVIRLNPLKFDDPLTFINRVIELVNIEKMMAKSEIIHRLLGDHENPTNDHLLPVSDKVAILTMVFKELLKDRDEDSGFNQIGDQFLNQFKIACNVA